MSCNSKLDSGLWPTWSLMDTKNICPQNKINIIGRVKMDMEAHIDSYRREHRV